MLFCKLANLSFHTIKKHSIIHTQSVSPRLTAHGGGPCHQYGVGAPPQQINTRARGHISQHDAKQVNESMRMKPSSMMNVKVNVTSNDDECARNVNECEEDDKDDKNVMQFSKLNLPVPEISRSNVKIRSEDPISFGQCEKNKKICRPKVKYRVQSSSEGKFNLEKANEGLASAKLVRKCREKSPRIQTAIRIFEKSENSSNTTFSNMEHLKGTPVKRKKVFDGGGARTVLSIFDEGTSSNLTRRGNNSESPAKKQKCGPIHIN